MKRTSAEHSDLEDYLRALLSTMDKDAETSRRRIEDFLERHSDTTPEEVTRFLKRFYQVKFGKSL